jgi:hypothetical protein
MMPNSNRAVLLQRLKLPAGERWAGDIYWSDRINHRLLNWVSEEFISRAKRMEPLTLCKPQLPHIWKEFNAFVSRSGRYVDLRDIDLLLLIDFEKALPRLGWSPTAVHLIEALLIVVRRYLHQQKILYGYFSEPLKRTPLAPIFPISIPDFRTIQSRYVQQANDYEVSYFDLITTYSKFRHALQKITGGDVRFEHHRGFITVAETPFPLPEAISERLLKLLRSRDILAKEGIFSSIGPLWKPFCRKIANICIAHNIPAYAPEAIWGFLSIYLWHLQELDVYNYEEIKSLWFPQAEESPSVASLKILDRVYRQITVGKKFRSYVVPYSPHSILVALVSCRQLSHDDRINRQGGTI